MASGLLKEGKINSPFCLNVGDHNSPLRPIRPICPMSLMSLQLATFPRAVATNDIS
jgi:hypothetical protein